MCPSIRNALALCLVGGSALSGGIAITNGGDPSQVTESDQLSSRATGQRQSQPNMLVCWQDSTQTVPSNDLGTRVDLEGQSNFRDLGGYTTKDGRKVVTGQIFRSGELSKLTASDLEKLKGINLGTCISFLTDDETRAHGNDVLPEGVKPVSLPIESDDGMVAVILEARKTGDFSRVNADLNPGFHRMLVDEAKQQYAACLREIIQSDAPVVFHCSHGVHRTGTAAAILLWSLGVPWETIREDYLLSNHYRKQEVDKRIIQLQQLAAKTLGKPVSEIDTANIEAFYRLEAKYIDATRDQILSRYGSIEKYMTNELGLASEEIDALRSKLLVDRPTPSS